MLLRSPRLAAVPGVAHGFGTRLGGWSTGPFATLHMGLSVGGPEPDGPAADAAVAANRRRFARALGGEALVLVDQVHGARVVAAEDAAGAQADGLLATTPGRVVGVRTADCAPILVAARDAGGRARAVAALHAGWRGACGGVVRAGVDALSGLGHDPAQMIAAVGPTIGLGAFEVGDEVVAAAESALGAAPHTVLNERGRRQLDLVDLVVRLLVQAGLPRDAVDVVGGCTVENAAMYFSYRRDGARSGRQVSGIALVEAPP
jgi:YfiH family protein